MTFCFTLADGEKYWLHAPTQAVAVEDLERLRPGVKVIHVKVVPEAAVDGPDGYRES